jgi:hypothetical protein
MELKNFPSRQDFVAHYNFPLKKQNEIGACWFMTSLDTQLKRFNNGLGKVIYFKTQERDLENTPYIPELESAENQIPVMYQMISDYVLIDEYVHPIDCKCGCIEDKQAQLLKLDGFDDCYLGLGESYGTLPALIYDHSKIIEKLKQDGMDNEEAQEYFDFNILGSYLGEKMPIFLMNIPLEDLGES